MELYWGVLTLNQRKLTLKHPNMPRNYRPRPYQQRVCEHCSMHFDTNHSRTKYCGDSCRVKAFYARQDTNKPLTPPTTGNLPFSLQNVGVVAAGATGAAILNYFANDRPAQQQIISLLESIKQDQTNVNSTSMNSDLEYLVDYVGAQVNASFSLGPQILQARQKRLSDAAQAKQQKAQAQQAELKKLLGH